MLPVSCLDWRKLGRKRRKRLRQSAYRRCRHLVGKEMGRKSGKMANTFCQSCPPAALAAMAFAIAALRSWAMLTRFGQLPCPLARAPHPDIWRLRYSHGRLRGMATAIPSRGEGPQLRSTLVARYHWAEDGAGSPSQARLGATRSRAKNRPRTGRGSARAAYRRGRLRGPRGRAAVQAAASQGRAIRAKPGRARPIGRKQAKPNRARNKLGGLLSAIIVQCEMRRRVALM